MSLPLKPKATAVWLIDNTALTFEQIAKFTGMHEVEVNAIADGEILQGIVGEDPIANGQLTQEELDRCSKDENADLALIQDKSLKRKSDSTTYVSMKARTYKPGAILYLLEKFPNLLTYSQVAKLTKTTAKTVASIADGVHKEIDTIEAVDPLFAGLCQNIDIMNALDNFENAKKEDAKKLKADAAKAKKKPKATEE